MAKRPKSESTPGTSFEITAVAGDTGAPAAVDALPAGVGDLIARVAEQVVPAARATGPDKFGVEFGIRQKRDGSAQLAEGTSSATFRVFLEWSGGRDA